MIVVTGGAGFIGSCLVYRLNQRSHEDILIVDSLDSTEKWKNLVALRYHEYLDFKQFILLLEADYFGDTLTALFHLGACSSTTERNAEYLMENNYRYTLRLALWCEKHPGCRFIYASSAATYGDGNRGYSDDHTLLSDLRPLNMYGYSKHLFDLHALARGWLQRFVGLKYFNVFGPNEYHKGQMRSVIVKAYPKADQEGTIDLFQSYNPQYQDGEQKRDFIYVKDAVEYTLFFYDNPSINGIFNVGTGVASSWNAVAAAMSCALKKKITINYIPMPQELISKYQYYTCACMDKLHQAGCTIGCRSLEASIVEYVRCYLSEMRHIGDERTSP